MFESSQGRKQGRSNVLKSSKLSGENRRMSRGRPGFDFCSGRERERFIAVIKCYSTGPQQKSSLIHLIKMLLI